MKRSLPDARIYAERVVLAALGCEGRPLAIRPPGAGGTASQACRLDIEGAPSLLLRFFDDRARALRSAGALRHLERLGLPAPRLAFADVRITNRILRPEDLPLYATAETWIEGTRVIESPDEEGAALSVAGLLARFHAICRPRWGRPGGFPEIRPYAGTTLAAAGRMIADLRTRGILDKAEGAEAISRLERWRRLLTGIDVFHLVHNDANRRNFILTMEGTLFAIDVRRISYEPCAEEIANALYHFCRRDETLAGRFVETWLRSATPSCRETWERFGPFFTAFNTLKRLHRRSGPRAASIVHPGENAPGAPPGLDARIPVWKEALLTLEDPPAPG